MIKDYEVNFSKEELDYIHKHQPNKHDLDIWDEESNKRFDSLKHIYPWINEELLRKISRDGEMEEIFETKSFF